MNRKLDEVGAILRKLDATMTISYGTGGYCIILKAQNGKQYLGYSWDIEAAFEVAVNQYSANQDNWADDTKS